jgi:signal transduction histidine kinase
MDYPKWQHRFTLERLHLVSIISIAILIGLMVLNLGIVIPAIEASVPVTLYPSLAYRCLTSTAAQVLGLVLGLVLLQDPRARKRPNLLFLLFSSTILLFPQIQAFLQGEFIFNPIGWMIVFMGQAILIPVRWRLHLLSQLVLLSSIGTAIALGFSNVHLVPQPDLSPSMTDALYALSAFQLVAVCFVSTLGVYLYERMMRQEFELRRQIRLFLHAVSHDLRNPVLGTLMVLKNLRNPNGETVLSQGLLERMIDSGDRQVELIDTLIEAYTVENQGVQLQCQPLALHDLWHAVITDRQTLLQDHDATLSLNIAPHLPPIWGDRNQLHRVWDTLLCHTLRHNPPGLHLTLSAQLTPTHLRCLIQDDGIGLAPDQQDQLFKLYTCGPNARQTLGLNLSLYICQQIIEAHHGRLSIHSTLGEGTTLCCEFPLAPRRSQSWGLM